MNLPDLRNLGTWIGGILAASMKHLSASSLLQMSKKIAVYLLCPRGRAPNQRDRRMTFKAPVFPVPCNIWHQQFGPAPTRSPDVVTTCSVGYLRFWSAQYSNQGGSTGQTFVVIRLPKGTNIHDALQLPLPPVGGQAGGDTIEAPAGSGRFYSVTMLTQVGQGFINEHLNAFCARCYNDTP